MACDVIDEGSKAAQNQWKFYKQMPLKLGENWKMQPGCLDYPQYKGCIISHLRVYGFCWDIESNGLGTLVIWGCMGFGLFANSRGRTIVADDTGKNFLLSLRVKK